MTCVSLTVTDDLCNVGKIIDCNKFSQLRRLRVTAYVIKFANLFKVKGATVEQRTELTADEVMRAEDLWVKESQKNLFYQKGFQAWKQQFNLFLHNRILRCKGRIDNAQVPYSTRHPAF